MLHELVLTSWGAGLPAMSCAPSCAWVNWCAAADCKLQAQPAGAHSGFAEPVLAATHAARVEGGPVDNLLPVS